MVLIDGTATNVRTGTTPGHSSTLMWCSDSMPLKNELGEAIEDLGGRVLGTYPPRSGSRFMIAQFPPGMITTMHRTDTVDYVIVLEGQIAVEFDRGGRVTLMPHDVLVQRGTNHRWINETDAPCKLAFVMLDAEPNGVGDPVPRDGIASEHKARS
jgi:quercetin dioxygenase-like cupin family protein